MRRLDDSIESEINAYWNAVTSGSTTLPLISDAELGQLIDGIQDLDDSEAPPYDLTDRLMRKSTPPAFPPAYAAPVAPSPLRAAEPFDDLASRRRKWSWLAAAALIVALLGVAALRWHDTPYEESVIPAAVSTEDSDLLNPAGSAVTPLAHLSFDPAAIIPEGPTAWSAATFRFFAIPAGSFIELPTCTDCSVLGMVVVIQGSIELRFDGPAIVSDQQNGDVRTWSSDQRVTLANGTSATFGLRSVYALPRATNPGDEPATLLMGFLYGEDFNVEIGLGTPANLFTTAWDLPIANEGMITLEIDKLTLAPGDPPVTADSRSTALYLLEQGALNARMATGADEGKAWTGPIGVSLDRLPAGIYDLENPGTESSVIYRMTISSADASDPGQ